MREMIIQSIWQKRIPGRPIVVANVIVVSNDDVVLDFPRAQNLTHRAKFFRRAMLREIADNQAKFRPRILRTDTGENSRKPVRTFRALKMRVIDNGKTERATFAISGKPRAAGP